MINSDPSAINVFVVEHFCIKEKMYLKFTCENYVMLVQYDTYIIIMSTVGRMCCILSTSCTAHDIVVDL